MPRSNAAENAAPATGFLRAPLPEEAFRALVTRERSRAVRSKQCFCVLRYRTRGRNMPDEARLAFIEVLSKRIRFTDDLGRFAQGDIGVLLPDTPKSGAEKLAEDIAQLCHGRFPVPSCDIYVYPFDGDDDDSGELPPANPVRSHAQRTGNRVAPPQSMNALFVRQLPIWKRAMDLLGASLGLTVLFPLLISVGVAVRLTSPGPALFVQKRRGLGGRIFKMVKFRTMRDGADKEKEGLREFSEQDGPAFKMEHDPRKTRLGSFLRKTSLDELPQLWNVLLGQMSLVGPRPLPVDEQDGCKAWQNSRMDVTPGITCFWQARARSQVPFDDWMRMDLRYVQERSFKTDLRLLYETVRAVFFGKGAS